MHGINSGSPSIPPGGIEIEVEAILSEIVIVNTEALPDQPGVLQATVEKRTQLVFDSFVQIGVDSKQSHHRADPVDERIKRLTSAIGQSSNSPGKPRKITGTAPPADLSASVSRAAPLDLLGELGSEIALRSGREIKVSDQSKLGRLLAKQNIQKYESKSGHTIVVVADTTFRNTLNEAFTKLYSMFNTDDDVSAYVAAQTEAPESSEDDDREKGDKRRPQAVNRSESEARAERLRDRKAQDAQLASEQIEAEQLQERRAQQEQEQQRYTEDKDAHLDDLARGRTHNEQLADSNKDQINRSE